jgi:hypothetical protein
MKRIVAVTVLFGALAVAAKLALKPAPARSPSAPSAAALVAVSNTASHTQSARGADGELLARFPGAREFVAQQLATFGHNARRIAASDGLGGLRLLGSLGDAAVCLYEEQPEEFRRLSVVAATGPGAVALLAAWGEYFDPRRSDAQATTLLAAALSKLPPRARRVAEQTPEALPFLLLEPRRTADTLERHGPSALEPLAFVDLSDGGESLRRALVLMERHGKLAMAACEEAGPAGLLLVGAYGPLLAELEPELGLSQSLAAVAVGADDLDELLATHRTRSLAHAMIHLNDRGLLADAASQRYAVRLAVEFADEGEQVLQSAGPHAAKLIYGRYPDGPLRNAVVRAIAQAGPAAAVAAEKCADSDGFRRIVERDGAAAVVAVAAAVSAEENRAFLAEKSDRTWSEAFALAALRLAGDSGEQTINLVARDGINRVRFLAEPSLEYYQLLPLYDLTHLGGVMFQGYRPTRGELAWAGLDAGLVAFDALSLLALQPEGAVAAETARAGAKSATKVAAKTAAREAVEHAAESVAQRVAGRATEQLVETAASHAGRQAVAAVEQAGSASSTRLAGSLAHRIGVRLSRWEAPAFARTGCSLVMSLPARRANKYVAVNAAQAGVGVLAIEKMEEYLSTRRDPSPDSRHSTTQSGGPSHEDE